MSARGSALAAGLSLAMVIGGGAARADCPMTRPTDPGGDGGIGYGSDPFTSYDTPEGRVRIWYATSGSQAPKAADAVAIAGSAVEAAIDQYKAMGYLAVLPDGGYPACASNGGDGRIDVYLVTLGGADGQTGIDLCTETGGVSKCSGFVMGDSRFETLGYASFEQGALTVLPHETFHLIQDAYDADVDRWWAEGTAQWAAKQLHPELTDLERFLPAYFDDTHRSIDAPPGGVVASFLYATAIWPVYLSERFGTTIVRSVFEELGESGGTVLDATAKVLAAKEASLGDEFLTFATWNAATGTRAGTGGYPLAKTYAMVTPAPLAGTDGTTAEVVNSGLGVYYYAIHCDAACDLTLESDPARNAANVLPLEGGVAQLDKVAALPAEIMGDAIVVVAGQSAAKTDAPFTVRVSVGKTRAPDGGGAGGSAGGGTSSGGHTDDGESGSGCSFAPPTNGEGALGFAGMFGVACFIAGRAHRRRRTRDPRGDRS